MKIAYFYMTAQGQKLVEKLKNTYPGDCVDKAGYKAAVHQCWHTHDALVFVMASGIVVRTIASCIQSKTKDPAVIVIDQAGRFVISLLSGHLGGANALAVKLAAVTGGEAVITTATDVAGVPAMDLFAKANHLTIENIHQLKYISSAMIEGQPVAFISQWPVRGTFPAHVSVIQNAGHSHQGVSDACAALIASAGAVVIVGTPSFCSLFLNNDKDKHFLFLSKKIYTVGTGCKKNMDSVRYGAALDDFLEVHGIDRADVAALATIDLKQEEPCIHAQARRLDLEIRVFERKMIETVDLNNASGKRIEPSAFVQEITGVGSVSEVCAWLGSGRGKIIVGKTKYKGITFALAKEEVRLNLR